ncbi:hypothetical protein HYX09_02495 [Candidatus Woesearchaeota archaeon]|nr:hypothetical protein [Candidatus Woesearchaeota archaeon]
MSIVINSLKESLKQIRANKLVLALIIILQASSLALLFFINYEPQVSIALSLNEMANYANALELDDSALDAGLMGQAPVLGPSPEVIAENFEKIMENLKLIFIYSSVALILSESLAWALSYRVAAGKFSLKFLIKEAISFAAFSIVIGAVLFYFIDSNVPGSLFGSQELSSFGLSVLAMLLISYFMLVAAAMPVRKPKEFFRKMSHAAFKKAHIVLAAYLSVMLSFAALVSIISYFDSFLVLIMGAISLLFLGALARVFLIRVMHRLAQ